MKNLYELDMVGHQIRHGKISNLTFGRISKKYIDLVKRHLGDTVNEFSTGVASCGSCVEMRK